MLESAGSSKTRDALLEKLKERIKERDRALEVRASRCHAHCAQAPNTMCTIHLFFASIYICSAPSMKSSIAWRNTRAR